MTAHGFNDSEKLVKSGAMERAELRGREKKTRESRPNAWSCGGVEVIVCGSVTFQMLTQ